MKITVSVTNDLLTDQRVHKVCTTLMQNGYEVKLIGRKLHESKPLRRQYHTYRMRLLANRSFWFYAEYNIRLFFFLLFDNADIYLSNDTDTLIANYLVSRLRKKPLLFDAHEMFPEVPEIINRKWVKAIWSKIEDLIFPKLKNSYTVCQSIADIYNAKYTINMQVIRNVPFYCHGKQKMKQEVVRKSSKKILLYQGAVNVGRGIERMIDAMPFLDNCIFYVIGDGDILNELKNKVNRLELHDRVIFFGKVPFELLPAYTECADIGINLLENCGLNYYYSLPNRLFDYIQKGIPILTCNFPEIRKIVEHYKVGTLINNYEPQFLANTIKQMLACERNIAGFEAANRELTWENEVSVLLEIVKKSKLSIE